MQSAIDWKALILTLILIIVVRESAVWLLSLFGHAELGNLAGLFFLLIALVIYRNLANLSPRLIEANNRIMREGLFAFLPISGGSLLILLSMGKEIPAFLFILVVSTLIPMWIYAKMAKKWLN
ncbi:MULTISPECIES: hypothetical protein [unclassified Acinetobacter]|uniref:hypothetical protein n=1 Tax=unclassified Acinetobacter TaxID=196816 RepID=UPI0035BB8BFF